MPSFVICGLVFRPILRTNSRIFNPFVLRFSLHNPHYKPFKNLDKYYF
nr:MAG TPA: hypothetical protein [Caudoviricetes sp.]